MHRILIIGCGSIGERHLRCFQKTGRAQMVACDANPELLATVAATYGVQPATSWELALRDASFDAAIICTPAHLHVPMATALLQRGLHVLIEKPLAPSLAGVAELIRARDAACRQAAVAYVLHCYPMLSAAREFILSGELGPVLQAVASSGQYFPGGRPAHTVHYSKTYYRDRRTGGGAIQDALTHVANWMESVVGPADSLLCDCAHLAVPEVTVEDTVHVAARHGATLVSYSLNQFQAPNESTLQFNTARGSVRIEVHHRRWGILRLGETSWTWHEVPALERDEPFVTQANRFLDAIEGKPSRLCSLEAGVQTLRFNLAALAAAESGQRVTCASLTADVTP
jgi:predicted dehydrogenase